MKMPVASTVRSPIQVISRPQNGLTASRIRANTEMTAPTSVLPTPKLRANTGSTGTSTPKPTATQKAISPRTSTSRGREVRSRSRRRTAAVRGTAQVCRTDRGPDGFAPVDTVDDVAGHPPGRRRTRWSWGRRSGSGCSSRESKVATEQALEEASDLADEAAARRSTPRRGLFEGEPPRGSDEVRVTSIGRRVRPGRPHRPQGRRRLGLADLPGGRPDLLRRLDPRLPVRGRHPARRRLPAGRGAEAAGQPTARRGGCPRARPPPSPCSAASWSSPER